MITAVTISLILIASQSVGQESPKIQNFRLLDLNRKSVELYDLLAKGPVLLDFWATWCSPCLKSMPQLQKLHESYSPNGLQIVGINVDGPRSASKIRPFIRGRRVTFMHLMDTNSDVMRLLGVQAIPTSILIAQDGTILRRRVAAEVANHHELEDAIRSALMLDDVQQ